MMVTCFEEGFTPVSVWAWSALSSVPRASDHLTTHRCFVSRAHLLVRACLALGTSGWGKGQTWKVLLESSLSSLWEHASLLSSLAAAQPCDGRWLFCHNLPVFPHHYHTRLLLIWDNPALARHYQFSAKVHRILRYSRPQSRFDILENVFLLAPDTYSGCLHVICVCPNGNRFGTISSKFFWRHCWKFEIVDRIFERNEMWHCSLKAEKWWQCLLTAAVLEWHSTLCINTRDSRGVSVTLCTRKLIF